MYGRGHAKRNDELCTNASTADEVESTRSGGSVVGNDTAARSTRLSDAQSSIRQTGSMAGMPSISSAPTMRSRVTVVCAECKKQKLRCDRRIPCESCVKRNTVSRCIYTPAAIEKVDVTSINNRLRVVEGSLNALGLPTHGYQYQVSTQPQPFMQPPQGPPGLGTPVTKTGAHMDPVSVNGTSQGIGALSASNSGSGWYVPPTPRILARSNDARCATTIAPLDGVSALWIREVGQDKGSETGASRTHQGMHRSVSGNMVSNKDLGVDLQPIDREASGGVPAFGFGATRGMDAKQLLALHAGVGISPSFGELRDRRPETRIEHVPGGRTTGFDSTSIMYEALAEQLLTQLPPRRVRREMLIYFGIANLTEGVSCVPFRALCTAIESTCSSLSRGRADGSGNFPAFSAIAEATAALSIGALLWALGRSAGTTSNSEELRGLVARLIDTLDAPVAPQMSSSPLSGEPSSSSPSGPGSEHEMGELQQPDMTTAYALYRLARLALSMHTARHGHAARDVALIHTHVLSTYYLLLAQRTSAEFSDAILPPELPPLIGALIWDARAMGLGVDPDQFDPLDDAQSNITDAIPEGSQSTWVPVKREEDSENAESRPKSTGMNLFAKEVRRRLWWRVVLMDLFVCDSFGYNATIAPSEFNTRLPANVDDSCFCPDSQTLPPPNDDFPERNNTFYTAKLRLLELTKRAPVKAFRSGLVPTAEDPDHVTAAAAQRIADEVVQWLEDLPDWYKFDAIDEDVPPTSSLQLPMVPLRPPSAERLENSATRALLNLQRCDLMFHANHILLRLFTPILFSRVAQYPRSAPGHCSSIDMRISADHQFAGLRAIEPALAVVHAAEVQMACAADAPRGIFLMSTFPRRLFDAAVVLAYTAIQQPLYTSPFVIDAVRTASDILSRVLKRNGGPADTNSSHSTEAERIVKTLLKRAERARMRGTPIMAGVKRKHEEVDVENHQFDGPFRFPFLGSGIANTCTSPIQASTSSMDPSGRFSGNLATLQHSGSAKSGSSSRTHDGDQSSRYSSAPGHRGRNVPVVSIRQRLRDREDNRPGADVSRTTSTTTEPGPPVSSSTSTLLQPPRPFPPQSLPVGHSVSPSPSVFAGEIMSASPISPVPHYSSSNGTRPVYSVTGDTFRETGFMVHNSRPTGATPLQDHSPSSVTSQYPSFTVPSHSASPYLHHHPGHKPSASGNRTVGAGTDNVYSAGSSHAESSGLSTNENELGDNTQSWAPPSLSEPTNMHSHHATTMYAPVQQPYPHPEAWNAGQHAEAGMLAPWNMPSFTNWNHDPQ